MTVVATIHRCGATVKGHALTDGYASTEIVTSMSQLESTMKLSSFQLVYLSVPLFADSCGGLRALDSPRSSSLLLVQPSDEPLSLTPVEKARAWELVRPALPEPARQCRRRRCPQPRRRKFLLMVCGGPSGSMRHHPGSPGARRQGLRCQRVCRSVTDLPDVSINGDVRRRANLGLFNEMEDRRESNGIHRTLNRYAYDPRPTVCAAPSRVNGPDRGFVPAQRGQKPRGHAPAEACKRPSGLRAAGANRGDGRWIAGHVTLSIDNGRSSTLLEARSSQEPSVCACGNEEPLPTKKHSAARARRSARWPTISAAMWSSS